MTWLTHIPLVTYKEHYELVDFIETGSWRGAGISFAQRCGYDRIFSCDISPEYAGMCQKNFPFAKVSNADSLTFLESILPTVKTKTLFWLDAHFPGMYGTDETPEEYRLPLLAEINLIKTYKEGYEHDVIICDDIRTLRSTENPRYREGEVTESEYLDINWNEFVTILDDTHVAKLSVEHDGVMTFFPKDKYKPQDEFFTYRT